MSRWPSDARVVASWWLSPERKRSSGSRKQDEDASLRRRPRHERRRPEVDEVAGRPLAGYAALGPRKVLRVAGHRRLVEGLLPGAVEEVQLLGLASGAIHVGMRADECVPPRGACLLGPQAHEIGRRGVPTRRTTRWRRRTRWPRSAPALPGARATDEGLPGLAPERHRPDDRRPRPGDRTGTRRDGPPLQGAGRLLGVLA